MRFSDELKRQIIDAYQSGESQTSIAKRLGLYSASVSRVLRKAGKKARQRNDPITDEERQQIRQLYEAGSSVGAVADRLGRSKAGVSRVVNELGIMRARGATRLMAIPSEIRDLMVAQYLGGKSVQEVADANDTSVTVVWRELRRRKVETRPQKRKTRFADEPEIAAQILKGYANGCSVPLLAEVYKCSRDAIKQVLLEADVTIRKEGSGKRVYQFIDRKGREHWMRSSWEIKTAIYLDQKGTDWDYEKETYEIGERKRYTPDFWLYAESGQVFLIIDVKGWLYPDSDDRIRRFRESHPNLPFELWGQEELTDLGILDLEIPVPPKGRKRQSLRSHISKAEIAEAVRLYESNMSARQVAEALNRSESAIARHLQLLGKTRPRHQTKKMLSADRKTRDRIAKTYLSGLSMTATAQKLGISRDVVAREIKSRGLSRNRSQAQLQAHKKE